MTSNPNFSASNISFLFIDLQDKLLKAISGSESLIVRNVVLARAAKELGVPLVATSQYRHGLGEVVPDLMKEFTAEVADKTSFSCCGDDTIRTQLRAMNREWIVVSGIETHICVLQTVLDLRRQDQAVAVVADAVGARRTEDHRWGLRRMEQAGAMMVTTEMLVYELMRSSSDPVFKKMLPLIKNIQL